MVHHHALQRATPERDSSAALAYECARKEEHAVLGVSSHFIALGQVSCIGMVVRSKEEEDPLFHHWRPVIGLMHVFKSVSSRPPTLSPSRTHIYQKGQNYVTAGMMRIQHQARRSLLSDHL